MRLESVAAAGRAIEKNATCRRAHNEQTSARLSRRSAYRWFSLNEAKGRLLRARKLGEDDTRGRSESNINCDGFRVLIL